MEWKWAEGALFFYTGKGGMDVGLKEAAGWLVGWLVVFRRLFLGHFLLLRRVEVDGERRRRMAGSG